MPINVTCPNCASGLSVPDAFAGQTIRCGGCSQSFDVPPALPVSSMAPPPLPTVVDDLVEEIVSPPRAKVVAAKPAPTLTSSTPSINRRVEMDDDERPERPKAKIGTVMIILAVFLLFACGGLVTIVMAFTKITQAVADKKAVDAKREAEQPAKDVSPNNVPPPKTATFETRPKPITPAPPVTPPVKVPADPPRSTGPSLAGPTNVPSPVGIKGLVMAIAFDDATIRDYVSRTKLESSELVTPTPGPTKDAARIILRPSIDESEPFIINATPFVDSFHFRDDTPFTIAVWVRAISTNPITAFGLSQSTNETAPRLAIKASNQSVSVEIACDESDSEKVYQRKANIKMSQLTHVAITRTKDGLLKTFFNGVESIDPPSGSLKAEQAVAMKFKKAGFGQRGSRTNGLMFLDEFCLFYRDLTADEIRKLAGVSEKK